MFYERLGIDPLRFSPDARKLVRGANIYRRGRGEELHTDHFVTAAVRLGFVDDTFPSGIAVGEIEKRMLPIDDEISRVELLSVRRAFSRAVAMHHDGTLVTSADIIREMGNEVHSRARSLLISQYPLI